MPLKTKSWSLRAEIVISLALIVAAATGLMGLVVFKFARTEMIQLKVETAQVLIRAMESRLAGDKTAASLLTMSDTLVAADFTRMIVTDRTGRVLSQFGFQPGRGLPEKSDLVEAMASGQVHTGVDGMWLWDDGPVLTIAAPLHQGLQVVGAVGLYSPLTELRATWTRIILAILTFQILDTLIAVIFGTYLLSRRLVRPLKAMVGRVEDLAASRYQPGQLALVGDNEIGRLEEAFERMAAQILSSHKRLEENLQSLQQAQAGLVQSEKMASVGRLAAGLAHELGNPLGSLMGFVHLLKRSDLNEADRLDYLGRMNGELLRIDTIIRTLLDFARPAPAKIGPLDLARAVNDALALASVQKWFSGIQVRKELTPALPPARADANSLTQVLLNLLANAGQALGGTGTVTITTAGAGPDLSITVQDNGPGISPEDLPHIFDPFFTRKEPGLGTGLGLSVSLSIVQSFGGRLEARSEPGHGAAFSVYLPVWGL